MSTAPAAAEGGSGKASSPAPPSAASASDSASGAAAAVAADGEAAANPHNTPTAFCTVMATKVGGPPSFNRKRRRVVVRIDAIFVLTAGVPSEQAALAVAAGRAPPQPIIKRVVPLTKICGLEVRAADMHLIFHIRGEHAMYLIMDNESARDQFVQGINAAMKINVFEVVAKRRPGQFDVSKEHSINLNKDLDSYPSVEAKLKIRADICLQPTYPLPPYTLADWDKTLKPLRRLAPLEQVPASLRPILSRLFVVLWAPVSVKSTRPPVDTAATPMSPTKPATNQIELPGAGAEWESRILVYTPAEVKFFDAQNPRREFSCGLYDVSRIHYDHAKERLGYELFDGRRIDLALTKNAIAGTFTTSNIGAVGRCLVALVERTGYKVGEVDPNPSPQEARAAAERRSGAAAAAAAADAGGSSSPTAAGSPRAVKFEESTSFVETRTPVGLRSNSIPERSKSMVLTGQPTAAIDEERLKKLVADYRAPTGDICRRFMTNLTLLVRRVYRLTSRHSWEPRILVITDIGVLLCSETGTVRRTIDFVNIREIIISKAALKQAISLLLPDEFDCVIKQHEETPRAHTPADIAAVIAYKAPHVSIRTETVDSGPLTKAVARGRHLRKPDDFESPGRKLERMKSQSPARGATATADGSPAADGANSNNKDAPASPRSENGAASPPLRDSFFKPAPMDQQRPAAASQGGAGGGNTPSSPGSAAERRVDFEDVPRVDSQANFPDTPRSGPTGSPHNRSMAEDNMGSFASHMRREEESRSMSRSNAPAPPVAPATAAANHGVDDAEEVHDVDRDGGAAVTAATSAPAATRDDAKFQSDGDKSRQTEKQQGAREEDNIAPPPSTATATKRQLDSEFRQEQQQEPEQRQKSATGVHRGAVTDDGGERPTSSGTATPPTERAAAAPPTAQEHQEDLVVTSKDRSVGGHDESASPSTTAAAAAAASRPPAGTSGSAAAPGSTTATTSPASATPTATELTTTSAVVAAVDAAASPPPAARPPPPDERGVRTSEEAPTKGKEREPASVAAPAVKSPQASAREVAASDNSPDASTAASAVKSADETNHDTVAASAQPEREDDTLSQPAAELATNAARSAPSAAAPLQPPTSVHTPFVAAAPEAVDSSRGRGSSSEQSPPASADRRSDAVAAEEGEEAPHQRQQPPPSSSPPAASPLAASAAAPVVTSNTPTTTGGPAVTIPKLELPAKDSARAANDRNDDSARGVLLADDDATAAAAGRDRQQQNHQQHRSGIVDSSRVPARSNATTASERTTGSDNSDWTPMRKSGSGRVTNWPELVATPRGAGATPRVAVNGADADGDGAAAASPDPSRCSNNGNHITTRNGQHHHADDGDHDGGSKQREGSVLSVHDTEAIAIVAEARRAGKLDDPAAVVDASPEGQDWLNYRVRMPDGDFVTFYSDRSLIGFFRRYAREHRRSYGKIDGPFAGQPLTCVCAQGPAVFVFTLDFLLFAFEQPEVQLRQDMVLLREPVDEGSSADAQRRSGSEVEWIGIPVSAFCQLVRQGVTPQAMAVACVRELSAEIMNEYGSDDPASNHAAAVGPVAIAAAPATAEGKEGN